MMQKVFIYYLISSVTLLMIDGFWLICMGKKFYMKQLAHLMSINLMWLPVILFYAIYAYGILHFVLFSALAQSYKIETVFLNGAFLGFIAYAAYNLTNQATLNSWPVIITLVDLTWGTFMTGLVSMLSYLVIKALG